MKNFSTKIMSLEDNLEKLLKLFQTVIIIMNEEQFLVLDDALHKCAEAEDMASRPVELPNCVVALGDSEGGRILRKYGGYTFDAQTWFDAVRSTYGPDRVTRQQFLEDILEELFVKDSKTFFTPAAWELFQEQLQKGLELIDSYIGAKSAEELQRIEQLAIQEAEEETYWEALEERRANW